MRFIPKILFICLAAAFVSGCDTTLKHNAIDGTTTYEPKYAKGFRILADSTLAHSRILRVSDPWQGASDCEQSLLLLAEGETAPDGFEGQQVNVPAERIAVMSSSFVAMFDAIGECGRIVGVSGAEYISNPAIAKAAADGRVREIGYESNLDFETIAAMRTDLVLLYGVYGEDKALTGKLRELGIPYIYIGDYVEPEPLGKAEWVVAIAAMCGKQAEGEAVFAEIARRYETLRDSIAQSGAARPRVMLNTPYRDTWFMPSTRSYSVRLIEDAGGEYVYPANDSASSVPVSLEQALLLASGADVWLNIGQCGSLDELRRTNPKFAGVKPVRSGRVYNNTKRMTPGGGSDFWESGAVAPDRILADLAKILHGNPPTDSLYYYKRLE